jgi:hypothetical protein
VITNDLHTNNYVEALQHESYLAQVYGKDNVWICDNIQSKQLNLWNRLYQEYKGYYTKEEINEMTFAELGELIEGLN